MLLGLEGEQGIVHGAQHPATIATLQLYVRSGLGGGGSAWGSARARRTAPLQLPQLYIGPARYETHKLKA